MKKQDICQWFYGLNRKLDEGWCIRKIAAPVRRYLFVPAVLLVWFPR